MKLKELKVEYINYNLFEARIDGVDTRGVAGSPLEAVKNLFGRLHEEKDAKLSNQNNILTA